MKNTFLILFLLFVSTLVQAQTWQQLDSLGKVLTTQQNFLAADSVLKIALEKAEAQYGRDTTYLRTAKLRAQVLMNLGKYQDLVTLQKSIKDITEKLYGRNSSVHIKECVSLGMLKRLYLNEYAEAEIYLKEAASILIENGEKNTTSYAKICYYLANSYLEQSKYSETETILQEAMAILETKIGKDSYDYLLISNALAALYYQHSIHDKAEKIWSDIKSITERVFGKNHEMYATVCNNLAGSYFCSFKLDKAEELYLEAKNIKAQIVDTNSPEYAIACTNLAAVFAKQKKYDLAEELNLLSIEIDKQNMPLSLDNYVNSLSNLANIYSEVKKYDKAEALYLEAISISERIKGANHLTYISNSINLAKLYEEVDVNKAIPIYQKVENNLQANVHSVFPILSEAEKQNFWIRIKSYFNDFAHCYPIYAIQNPVIMADLYDQTLFTKGIIFSSTQKIKNTILNSGDTVLVNQYNNWKKQRESYTKLYQLPLEEQKKQNLDLEGMKNQINDLEKDLSKKSALFGQNVQTKSYKWQEVKAKLAKNEVVIEIIKSDSAYIALFLTAQTENYPAFYLFKNAQELEDKFLNYYKNCIEFKIEDTVSYNAFWKPIADKLSTLNKKGFKKIYFSPDGVFHQLSLNTLKNTKTGKFLLEEANIQLIGSSRDLIELNKKSRDLSQNYENYQAHLLGYPIYGAENTEKEPEKKRDRSLGFSGMQSAVGVAGAVSLLPGTKKEVENVFGLFNQKKLKVNLLLAENATEEAVKNLKSPTILHVATHGFFIPEIKDSEVQDMQTAMNRNLLKNPFLRSGLLLAGCQKPNPDKEDGILTAEEVMNLTLDNTELVVLSACETGLGDIQAGEGVFGLQRAFQQAGAKSVLMSLWQVDDEATQTLMTEFYTALLKGQSKRQAFKTAQMNLKKRFPEPYYWGAFVMVGE